MAVKGRIAVALMWTSWSLPCLAQAPAADPADAVLIEANQPKYAAPNTRDRIGRIWAPVFINGKGPFRLVLDTSANSSAVVQSVVDRLAIAQPQPAKVNLVGVTGAAVVPVVKVDSMQVGEIELGSGKLPVVANVFGGAEGVLSPRGLNDKRIFVDFGNDQIRISRSNSRPAEPGYTRVALNIDRRQLPTFDLRVGGVKTRAILGTGAQRTIGNLSLQEALRKREREGQEQQIVGVTLDEAQGQSIAVPPIVIGDLALRNVQIAFADTYVFDQWKLTDQPTLLVGMDVIGSLDALVIDYKLKELHLRPRR
jgi:predicted aspartyl protease